ncbi:MAG: hypothetical protein A4E61_01941 [Syntrophorhabdus sp. PtaB.Bin184]|nr:MAG: hypothetical protein A4E61_01941 [Syntrophorhabdus sp. PtaB.Bin184]
METFAVAPSGHEPARELVDDDDLAVLDDVVHVAGEELMGLERLVDVVEEIDVLRVVEVLDVEDPLEFRDAVLGKVGAAGLFVYHEILLTLELRYQLVDLVVLVRRFLGGAGDDERRPRLVDEDTVHLVDDGVIELALDTVFQVVVHVVAEVVETELIVRPVGDVASIGVPAGRIVEVVDDDTHGKAQKLIHRTHPLGVPFRQVIVDGDHVDAEAGQGVEVDGQGGDEGFPFARCHLGDPALVQHDPADELDVEMAHSQGAPGRFAGDGKSFGQKGVEIFAPGEPFPEMRGHGPELIIA